ncbi:MULTISPECIES: lysozyme inhibitor LprI family protein [Methylorubrum]|uniref:lysozyme inhibitor LprI family protein n=1 Tax=Methylorubrum TaxID=2282523 RepID=UPI0020A21EF2|nr:MULTISPECIES: lysozyme inhibitor LprI family protein [Methylorubrum]MCP1547021.1 uncharacterized protein YecT (DUF1311 family) [Methylorubrum zatmanii]MCP1556363.1 uncharacterized protein YecT (DUF1311 family) [Methylorubrum extorquens]MCP1577324.1 uncharacterized protein YecT (DUF1311 family) [Methylorubrum extorquens]
MRGLGTMRSFRAILILSAWALAAPSLAQEADRTASPAKDAATIEACLKGKETSAKRRTCIGSVAGPCRDTQDGATTMGMSACISREHAIWDKLLNRTYQQAMVGFDDEGKAYLKGAQQSWLKFRSQTCQWPYHVYRGGTLAGPLSSECFMEQTALRTFDLMEIVENGDH